MFCLDAGEILGLGELFFFSQGPLLLEKIKLNVQRATAQKGSLARAAFIMRAYLQIISFASSVFSNLLVSEIE